MEKLFKDFAELAASILAERWRKMQTEDQAGSQPAERGGSTVETATVRVTVADPAGQTSAHATIKRQAE